MLEDIYHTLGSILSSKCYLVQRLILCIFTTFQKSNDLLLCVCLIFSLTVDCQSSDMDKVQF